MKTKHNLSIDEAVQLLQEGEAVAFPTETVYGLGADAIRSEAIDKIYLAKGRPSDNPLIIHIGAFEQIKDYAREVPQKAQQLIDAFWPGPLTIILPKQDCLADNATAGLDSVGIRMPSHPVAMELLKKVNLPIAAPSANTSGRPSPTSAEHVVDDLDGRIAGIVDGGEVNIGLESTVIDCTVEPPIILRPGEVTREEIEAVIGKVDIDKSLKDIEFTPKSPGMKYKHYAPNAPLTIIKGNHDFFQKVIDEAKSQEKKIGLLVTEENKEKYDADIVLVCGSQNDLLSVAQRLYDVLREFDEHDIDIIYSESFPDSGLGEAIMNRLLKASGYQVIEE